MKTILIIVLSCSLTASFAQMHFSIPVRELDTLVAGRDSSAFRMHPIQLDVEVNEANFDTYRLNTITTFYENISNSPFYKAKNTTTAAILELPKIYFDLKSTINADGSYNIDKLNGVLQLFSFRYRYIAPAP